MSGSTKFDGMHTKCRGGEYQKSQIKRLDVPNDKVPWLVKWPEYKPPEFTNPKVLKAPWADPDIKSKDFHPKFNALDCKIDRRSHHGAYEVVDGMPRNPHGRTGLTGRGDLGRWGPNHAADPIVTRWKPGSDKDGAKKHPESGKPILQFVAILRGDCKQWAIPGGMIDPGEQVSATLKREFGEEALSSLTALSPEEKKTVEQSVEKLFKSGGDKVYSGYVDDPRNTDNSWMETVAVNFHDEKGDSAARVDLKAGSDAAEVRWTDMGEDVPLYASHQKMLALVAEKRGAHW
jgi:ADP-ribose pyrophosphatase